MSEIIKNPNRNRPRPTEIRKPEYERLGVKPVPFTTPNNYGETSSLLSIAKSPNNNPNFQETISEVDGIMFGKDTNIPSKVEYRKDNAIIDNNEYMSFGFPDEILNYSDNDPDDNPLKSKEIPAIGDYILMIGGNIIMSGSHKIIEEKVKNILYGDDIDFDLSEVNQEEIVILKRVNLQVGVFIKD